MDSNTPVSTPTPTPRGPRFPGRNLALLALSAAFGGGTALGGAAALGGFDRATATTAAAQFPVAPGTTVVSDGTALSINEIYRRSGPGVVQITTTVAAGNQFQQSGAALGSGFVLDKEGHVITNYHVIRDATSIRVRFSNDDTLKAELVGSDPSTDIALLKVDAGARALTPLILADSDGVEVGDSVVAIGNPFGLERTVTAGIVSALQRAVEAPNGYAIGHVIQTDAPINHGNSGGPLLDTRGQVIGVNSQIATDGAGDGNVGIGFAVPSNTVKSVIGQLLATGKVEHAYLGISALDITTEIANNFRLPVDKGLVVQSVTEGSGAAAAGLKAGSEPVVIDGESFRMGGDVIVAAGGRDITKITELRDVIAERKPGEKLELKIYRGGKAMTVTVTLGRQPESPSP